MHAPLPFPPAPNTAGASDLQAAHGRLEEGGRTQQREVQARLAALAERVDEAAATAAGAAAVAGAAAQASAADATTGAAAAAAAADAARDVASATVQERVAPLADRLAQAEAALASLQACLEEAQQRQPNGSVAALDATGPDAATVAAAAALGVTVAALQAEVSALQRQQGAAAAQQAAAQQEVQRLASDLRSLESSAQAAASLAGRQEAVEREVQRVASELSALHGSLPAAPAVQEGTPASQQEVQRLAAQLALLQSAQQAAAEERRRQAGAEQDGAVAGQLAALRGEHASQGHALQRQASRVEQLAAHLAQVSAAVERLELAQAAAAGAAATGLARLQQLEGQVDASASAVGELQEQARRGDGVQGEQCLASAMPACLAAPARLRTCSRPPCCIHCTLQAGQLAALQAALDDANQRLFELRVEVQNAAEDAGIAAASTRRQVRAA